MKIFFAKDGNDKLVFFKDIPDLVRFSYDDPVEWTGYPFDFGEFALIKKYIEDNYDDIEVLSDIYCFELKKDLSSKIYPAR